VQNSELKKEKKNQNTKLHQVGEGEKLSPRLEQWSKRPKPPTP
jgi:hypothetical protein